MSATIVSQLASQGKLKTVDSEIARSLDTFFTETVGLDTESLSIFDTNSSSSSANSEGDILSEVVEFPAESFTISDDEETLGSGGYCSIHPVTMNPSALTASKRSKIPATSNSLVIKKSTKVRTTLVESAKRRFRLECGIAQYLRKQSAGVHPSYGVVFSREMSGIIMERADFTLSDLSKGLEEVLKINSSTVKSEHYWNYWHNIVRQLLTTAHAINVMHNNNMIHCDVKPSNILLTKDEDDDYVGRLADFGSTQIVPNAKKFQVVQALSTTPWYCAPESLSITPQTIQAFMAVDSTTTDATTKQDMATLRTLVTQYTKDTTSTTRTADQLLKTIDKNVQQAFISARSDVWAFGCTILEILNYGQNPIVAHYNGKPSALINDLLRYKYAIISEHMESFSTATLHTVNQHSATSNGILKQLDGFDIAISTNAPKELLELAQKCLIIDPYQRYSMSQVIDGLTKLQSHWDKLVSSSTTQVRKCTVPISISRPAALSSSSTSRDSGHHVTNNIYIGPAYSDEELLRYLMQRQELELIYNENISAPYLAYHEQRGYRQTGSLSNHMHDYDDEALDATFSRLQVNPKPTTRASVPKNSRVTNETYQSNGKYNGKPIYEGPKGGKYVLTDYGTPMYIKMKSSSTPSKPTASSGSSSGSSSVNTAVHSHISNLSKPKPTTSSSSSGSSSSNYTPSGTQYSSSGSANGREIYTGSKGGQFYFTDSGNKRYVSSPSPSQPTSTPTKSYASPSPSYSTPSYSTPSSSRSSYGSSSSSSSSTTSRATTSRSSYTPSGTTYSSSGSANGRTVYTGSRGGQFYFTSGGNKRYL